MTRLGLIEQAVLDWLREKGGPAPLSIDANTKLLEREMLDSLSILVLCSHLEQHFSINLPLEDFTPENFATPKTVAEMVARQLEHAAQM